MYKDIEDVEKDIKKDINKNILDINDALNISLNNIVDFLNKFNNRFYEYEKIKSNLKNFFKKIKELEQKFNIIEDMFKDYKGFERSHLYSLIIYTILLIFAFLLFVLYICEFKYKK